jgi:predicted nucleotidyltransferase
VDSKPQSLIGLAQTIAAEYSAIPQVTAVVLGGSLTAGSADQHSDIDLYVYAQGGDMPVSARARLIAARAERREIDNHYWETEDGWIETESGTAVDVTYRSEQGITEQIDRVLVRHDASVGYSTCFWYNVLNTKILFDRNGWYAQLQQQANQPYPELLRRAIITKNHPILRQALSAYIGQLKKAISRRDLVAINHRIAALLASYFDILFAVNRLPHPGEKRLVSFAEEHCAKLPDGMRVQVQHLLRSAVDSDDRVIIEAETLIESLDQLLQLERLLPHALV